MSKIRIINSCALSREMVSKFLFGAETRRFLAGQQSKWDEVSKYCLNNKKFLIVTPCINRNDNSGHYPNDLEWINFIDDTCKKLYSWGMRRHNGYVSLINEPMKYCTKEQYAHLISKAYPVVHSYGYECGIGNEQYTKAMASGDMYHYIMEKFKYLDIVIDIHLQGDCTNDADCRRRIANWFKDLVNKYKKPVDCTEAFYGDIGTDKGFGLLKNQLYHAETTIGCRNFGWVFGDLWENMFPWDVSGWHKLCMKINGAFRNSTTKNYHNLWVQIAKSKAPVPNIPIEEEDMKLELLGLNYVKEGQQVKWLQDILLNDYHVPNPGGIDGKLGTKTDKQIRDYQEEKGLEIDGLVGEQTTMKLINESSDPKKWYRNLIIYMAYE